MFIVYSLGNKNDHLPTDKYGVFNGATKWESSSKASIEPFKSSVYVKCSGTEGELTLLHHLILIALIIKVPYPR